MTAEGPPSTEALLRRQALYEQVIHTLVGQVNALRKLVADNPSIPVDWTPTIDRLRHSTATTKEIEAASAACDRAIAYDRGYITFEEFVGDGAKEKAPV